MTVLPTQPQVESATHPRGAEMATGKLIRSPMRYDSPHTFPKVDETPEPDGAMPPNLEEFIPGECLPDIIDIYVNKDFLFRVAGYLDCSNQSTEQFERPITFFRHYPRRFVVDNKGMFNAPS